MRRSNPKRPAHSTVVNGMIFSMRSLPITKRDIRGDTRHTKPKESASISNRHWGRILSFLLNAAKPFISAKGCGAASLEVRERKRGATDEKRAVAAVFLRCATFCPCASRLHHSFPIAVNRDQPKAALTRIPGSLKIYESPYII